MPKRFKGSSWSELTSERRHWRKLNLNQALSEAGLITKGHNSLGYARQQGWILDLTGAMNDTGHIL